ncbi:spermidine synthase [Labrenzia sp. C1B10]|uniref:spermine/spermidine synthase domain-containing protein n=1 Tax=unclassified Labrenzia TaxID=2648686 RepID=UPI0003B8EC1D|nr:MULTISPECIES: spermidine synthase [unclassified Labrenzia]ERP97099.1 spermidine synthase [Labrenzia sp. C1B10]ERS09220.1 spermidine synthase [Labrenzia sp. C1B70]
MSRLFEELDYAPTPIGAISLRRRHILALKTDVFEILLGEEHLMSSLFTASEIALADKGLAALGGDTLDVLVGGLGLGYTAQAVLAHESVADLTVVDLLEPVIRWHEEGLVPMKTELADNPRCRLVQGDFFAMAASEDGFDRDHPGRQYDALLIDIDHTPERLLHGGSKGFYTPEGLRSVQRFVKPGGIVGLWSDEAPDEAITALLGQAFDAAWAEPVVFPNPLQDGREVTQAVYLGRKG